MVKFKTDKLKNVKQNVFKVTGSRSVKAKIKAKSLTVDCLKSVSI